MALHSSDEIKDYLDDCIRFWRALRDDDGSEHAVYYIDAFQSVRMTIFDETLDEDDDTSSD